MAWGKHDLINHLTPVILSRWSCKTYFSKVEHWRESILETMCVCVITELYLLCNWLDRPSILATGLFVIFKNVCKTGLRTCLTKCEAVGLLHSNIIKVTKKKVNNILCADDIYYAKSIKNNCTNETNVHCFYTVSILSGLLHKKP